MIKSIEKILFILIFFILGAIYSEYRNRDLQKYIPLEQSLQQISNHEYDYNEYDCLDFSKEGRKILTSQGIESSIIVGYKEDDPDTQHAFLGIWIEPQTGNFTNNYTFERIYDK